MPADTSNLKICDSVQVCVIFQTTYMYVLYIQKVKINLKFYWTQYNIGLIRQSQLNIMFIKHLYHIFYANNILCIFISCFSCSLLTSFLFMTTSFYSTSTKHALQFDVCECIVVRLANRVWAIEYAISVPHRNRLCNQLWWKGVMKRQLQCPRE